MPRSLNILVGFEFTGAVRREFRKLGHNAWSCDLRPAEDNDPHHIQCDIFDGVLTLGWDMGIFFPDCTYLCSSGMHWTTRGLRDPALTEKALEDVRRLMECDIPRWSIENPIGCISTRIRKPDQIVQPWMFGHPESKSTCLWLHNLPPLTPTNVLQKPASGRWSNQTASGQNKLGPSPTRGADRARTYSGIAQAMASQWSNLSPTP